MVVVAQFFNAVVVLIDKYLVSHPVLPRPTVYAFYVSMLSGVALILLPFGVISFPGFLVIWQSLFSGITFVVAIVFLYLALQRADASDVVPVLGATSAIATFILRFYFIDESLPTNFIWGFLFLVLGTAFISHYRFKWRGLSLIILSGVLLGVSTMLVKLVFVELESIPAGFANGFFWTRMANVVAGLGLLLWPPTFFAVTCSERKSAYKAKWLIVANKALGGFAFLLILIAINLGDVAIVNALGGMQFVFLLVFAFICSKRLPALFRDAESPENLRQKIIAVSIIVLGFFVLFI